METKEEEIAVNLTILRRFRIASKNWLYKSSMGRKTDDKSKKASDWFFFLATSVEIS